MYKTVDVFPSEVEDLYNYFEDNKINTICTEAKCPNIGECFSKKTATFMILGKNCTRNCGFCNVKSGKPEKVSDSEIDDILDAIEKLNLKYVVITSVTRDDLKDGGAQHYAKAIRRIKDYDKNIIVEILIPDFNGLIDSLDIVLNARPDVVGHNIETVPRLYSTVRKKANFKRSLDILRYIKKRGFIAKTGIMLGLGEKEDEVFTVLKDIKNTGCDIITIGQYLQPTIKHNPVLKYISDEEFDFYNKKALEYGIRCAISGSLVRSSYKAMEIYNNLSKAL